MLSSNQVFVFVRGISDYVLKDILIGIEILLGLLEVNH